MGASDLLVPKRVLLPPANTKQSKDSRTQLMLELVRRIELRQELLASISLGVVTDQSRRLGKTI